MASDAQARGWGKGWPTDRSADMTTVTATRSGAKWEVHKAVAPILGYIVNEAERRGYLFHRPGQVHDDWGYANRPIAGTRVPSNHCLSGDARVVTRDGLVEIRSLDGMVAEVLTRDPQSPRNRGRWVKAPFTSYGEEPAREIVLARGRTQRKVITATDLHRWFVRLPSKTRSDTVVERTTVELEVGDRLATCLPPAVSAVQPSAFGVMHGIVFGDGSVRKDQSTFVRLWGKKAVLRAWFPDASPAVEVTAPSGLTGVEIGQLPPGFKDDIPGMDAPAHYRAGWLAGLIATDGHCRYRELRLSARDRHVLESVTDLALGLGIATAPITNQTRSGGYKPGVQYSIQFLAETVPEWLLLRDDHRTAFGEEFGRGGRRTAEWRVVSIGPLVPTEVYCATVEETGAFVLEDWILTGNSWGLAVDIDATKYPQGQRRSVPPDWLIALFKQWSWDWGGGWKHADPMHFEFNSTPNRAAQLVAMLAASHVEAKPVPVPPGTPSPIAPPVSVPATVPIEEDDMIIRNTEDGALWAVSATHMHHLTPDQWNQRAGVEHPPIIDKAPLEVWSMALAGRQVV